VPLCTRSEGPDVGGADGRHDVLPDVHLQLGFFYHHAGSVDALPAARLPTRAHGGWPPHRVSHGWRQCRLAAYSTGAAGTVVIIMFTSLQT